MILSVTRVSSPANAMSVNGNLDFSPEELGLAFDSPMDEEEKDLFSLLFSPDWDAAAISQKYMTLSNLALRIEGAQKAATLDPTAGEPVLKGKK